MMAPPFFCLNFVLRHVSTAAEAMATDAASTQRAIRVCSLWPVMPCVRYAYAVCTVGICWEHDDMAINYPMCIYVYMIHYDTIYDICIYRTLFFNVEV